MSTGHSCPRTTRSQQRHILVSSDQEPRGVCLGPAYGLNSIQLPQQDQSSRPTRLLPCPDSLLARKLLFGLRDSGVGDGPPFPELLHRDKKMQVWGPGFRVTVIVSGKQDAAPGWACISCQNGRNVHCASSLLLPSSPVGAASKDRWVPALETWCLLAHA